MAERELPGRIAYIDNLRSTMVFLVVASNAAATYSHMRWWYYYAPGSNGAYVKLAFLIFQYGLLTFFMGILFLLAGYFTPISYDRKGVWRFLRDRALRLGVPTLLYVFVIHDAIGHYLLGWHGDQPFWPNYVYYLTHWDWVDGTGPMWFTLTLLAFSCLYVLFRAVVPACGFVPRLPGPVGLLIGGLVLAAVTFLVRTVFPVEAVWHNFQFSYFPQYALLFVAGIMARRGDWLARFPTATGRWLFWGSLWIGLLSWEILMIVGGNFTQGILVFGRGWSWQNLAFCIWEQLLCVAACVALLVTYRERFNTGGRASRLFSANSFGVYVFHAPILVVVALALEPWQALPLAKFAVTAVLSFAATLLFVHYIARRIPLLKRIL